MPLQCQAGVIVEILIEVGLAVAVQIVQLGDLVTAGDVDVAVDDPQAERLVQACGEAFPSDFLEGVVEPGDDPDVTVPGAQGGAAIGKEVKSAKADRSVPRIILGELN